MKKLTLVTAALIALASPAYAHQCPQKIAELDAMMQQHGSMITPQQAAQIRDLRAKAEAEHKAGRHDASLEAVRQAHRAMGM